MATIQKTGVREVSIQATGTSIVGMTKLQDDYTVASVIADHNVTDTTEVITYTEDGLYFIAVDDFVYIDLCVEDVHDHIKTDVLDILSTPINDTDHTMARYDFMTLLLLGLHFFGNTVFDLLEQSDMPSITDTYKQIQDAISRCKLYMELNGSTAQSSNA